jgi:phosphoribosylformimino-5-aminoimidazole carboxamide ribotide isomerase
MTIIPAIDIINGKCVRLTKGDYAQQKIYNDSPVDVARQFADAGFTRLHVVDLDGARAGKIINMAVLENIAAATHMVIDFGGGVKHINDVEAVLNAGAAMVTIGSLAVKQPEILEAWIMEFGAGHFFIGADVLEGNVKISGWQQDGGIGIFDFIENLIRVGATNIFCTDIAKDGMMQGPAVELYTNMLERYPQINLTASGGVSHIDDVKQLKEIGCSGAIIGKAIYENLITLEQLIILNS